MWGIVRNESNKYYISFKSDKPNKSDGFCKFYELFISGLRDKWNKSNKSCISS